MTVQQWLKPSVKKLKAAGISSSHLDAQLLLAHALGTSREWLAAHGDEELSSDQLEQANQICARRVNHEPLAYITSSKEFYGRTFYVDNNVLIPRPESEAIIDLLKSFNKDHPCNRDDPCILYDIGTGSGCLAVTAKLELPGCKVVGTDVSETALDVARENAQKLSADIEFITSDLLSKIQGLPSAIYLANLPYVPDGMITSTEITKEPSLALFSGTDGLDHYRKLWAQVSKLSDKPLAIIAESLEDQHPTMRQLAASAGYAEQKAEDLAQLFVRA